MTTYEDIERMSKERKRDALMVTAELGKASGIRVGVEIIRAIAKGRRSVSSSELIAVALTMEEAADKIGAKANAKMKEMLA